ncbi:lytic transglycosylase domain-containing protein [Candidatus Woesearchaeota archaeon]|nr:lytic transglycosylase domain-containing protein [Candidatus Woesearchaeota archaeon]
MRNRPNRRTSAAAFGQAAVLLFLLLPLASALDAPAVTKGAVTPEPLPTDGFGRVIPSASALPEQTSPPDPVPGRQPLSFPAAAVLLITSILGCSLYYRHDDDHLPERRPLITLLFTLAVVLGALMVYLLAGTSGDGGITGAVTVDDALLALISSYDPAISQASIQYGVEVPLIKAVMTRESRGVADIVSPVGAAGLMQLMPGTARDEGLEVPDYPQSGTMMIDGQQYSLVTPITDPAVDERFDPEKNIRAGTAYLKKQLAAFTTMELALAAYNWGPGNVEDNCAAGWTSCTNLPDETRSYVGNVSAYYTYYGGRGLSAVIGSSGRYLLKPSFKHTMYQNFDAYSHVAEALVNATTLCSGNHQCVADWVVMNDEWRLDEAFIPQSTGYDWLIRADGEVLTTLANATDVFPETEKWFDYCETPGEVFFNDFVESFLVCNESVQDGCVCNISIPDMDIDYYYDIILDNYSEKAERFGPAEGDPAMTRFSFRVNPDWPQDTSSPILYDTALNATNYVRFNASSHELAFEPETAEQTVLTYRHTGTCVPLLGCVNMDFWINRDELHTGRVPLDEAIGYKLYKSDERMGILSPEAHEAYDDAHADAPLEYCAVRPRMLKVCVLTAHPQFEDLYQDTYFDRYRKEQHETNPLIKLAFYNRDVVPPPPVGNLSAVDKLRDSGRVLLKWTAPDAQDIAGYRIYRSERDLSALTLEQIRRVIAEPPNETELRIHEESFDAEGVPQHFGSIDLSYCYYNRLLGDCVYMVSVEKDLASYHYPFLFGAYPKAHFFLDPDYVYIVDVPDGIVYSFVVTAFDFEGNEITNDPADPSQRFPSVRGGSIDDAPPGNPRDVDIRMNQTAVNITLRPDPEVTELYFTFVERDDRNQALHQVSTTIDLLRPPTIYPITREEDRMTITFMNLGFIPTEISVRSNKRFDEGQTAMQAILLTEGNIEVTSPMLRKRLADAGPPPASPDGGSPDERDIPVCQSCLTDAIVAETCRCPDGCGLPAGSTIVGDYYNSKKNSIERYVRCEEQSGAADEADLMIGKSFGDTTFGALVVDCLGITSASQCDESQSLPPGGRCKCPAICTKGGDTIGDDEDCGSAVQSSPP